MGFELRLRNLNPTLDHGPERITCGMSIKTHIIQEMKLKLQTYAGHPSPVAEEKRVTKAIPKWLKFQSMSDHSLSTCCLLEKKERKF